MVICQFSVNIIFHQYCTHPFKSVIRLETWHTSIDGYYLFSVTMK